VKNQVKTRASGPSDAAADATVPCVRCTPVRPLHAGRLRSDVDTLDQCVRWVRPVREECVRCRSAEAVRPMGELLTRPLQISARGNSLDPQRTLQYHASAAKSMRPMTYDKTNGRRCSATVRSTGRYSAVRPVRSQCVRCMSGKLISWTTATYSFGAIYISPNRPNEVWRS
jgi:hypothetical protein